MNDYTKKKELDLYQIKLTIRYNFEYTQMEDYKQLSYCHEYFRFE